MKRLFNTFIALLVSAAVLTPALADAQNRFDALRFSNWYPGQDAINAGFGGGAAANGFGMGSVQFNPATGALIPTSQFSFSLSSRNVEQEALYRNATFSNSENQVSIGDFSFIYKFPVTQGDLTVGIGYAQLADFNRTYAYNVTNAQNTITDMFLQSGYYFDIAFNAFAIDDFEGESDPTSVWREPFPFVGVKQNAMLEEWGQLGEITTFIATEFRKDLFMGFSIGVPVGSYNYRLNFVETPPETANEYDVVYMFMEDEITANISGFNIRGGLVYKATDWLQVGISGMWNSLYEVSESFNTYIATEFTDGSFFDDDFNGTGNYKFQPPNRFMAGLTVKPLDYIQLSGSAEFVDYSDIELSQMGSGSMHIHQNTENRAIRQEFDNVINFRAGVSYEFSENFTLRGGYAYHPSPRKNFADAARSFYSTGFSLRLGQDMYFDSSLQMAQWEDINVAYSFTDAANNPVNEVIDEKIRRFNFFAGIRLQF